MLDFLRVNESSNTPIYRQVYDQLRVAIEQGTLPTGHRLPPTRELAGQLGLNRTTISAAYSLLEADGLIEGQVGRGSFVRMAVPNSSVISFASSRPADHEFPLADFQATCADVTRGAGALSILQLRLPIRICAT